MSCLAWAICLLPLVARSAALHVGAELSAVASAEAAATQHLRTLHPALHKHLARHPTVDPATLHDHAPTGDLTPHIGPGDSVASGDAAAVAGDPRDVKFAYEVLDENGHVTHVRYHARVKDSLISLDYVPELLSVQCLDERLLLTLTDTHALDSWTVGAPVVGGMKWGCKVPDKPRPQRRWRRAPTASRVNGADSEQGEEEEQEEEADSSWQPVPIHREVVAIDVLSPTKAVLYTHVVPWTAMFQHADILLSHHSAGFAPTRHVAEQGFFREQRAAFLRRVGRHSTLDSEFVFGADTTVQRRFHHAARRAGPAHPAAAAAPRAAPEPQFLEVSAGTVPDATWVAYDAMQAAAVAQMTAAELAGQGATPSPPAPAAPQLWAWPGLRLPNVAPAAPATVPRAPPVGRPSGFNASALGPAAPALRGAPNAGPDWRTEQRFVSQGLSLQAGRARSAARASAGSGVSGSSSKELLKSVSGWNVDPNFKPKEASITWLKVEGEASPTADQRTYELEASIQFWKLPKAKIKTPLTWHPAQVPKEPQQVYKASLELGCEKCMVGTEFSLELLIRTDAKDKIDEVAIVVKEKKKTRVEMKAKVELGVTLGSLLREKSADWQNLHKVIVRFVSWVPVGYVTQFHYSATIGELWFIYEGECRFGYEDEEESKRGVVINFNTGLDELEPTSKPGKIKPLFKFETKNYGLTLKFGLAVSLRFLLMIAKIPLTNFALFDLALIVTLEMKLSLAVHAVQDKEHACMKNPHADDEVFLHINPDYSVALTVELQGRIPAARHIKGAKPGTQGRPSARAHDLLPFDKDSLRLGEAREFQLFPKKGEETNSLKTFVGDMLALVGGKKPSCLGPVKGDVEYKSCLNTNSMISFCKAKSTGYQKPWDELRLCHVIICRGAGKAATGTSFMGKCELLMGGLCKGQCNSLKSLWGGGPQGAPAGYSLTLRDCVECLKKGTCTPGGAKGPAPSPPAVQPCECTTELPFKLPESDSKPLEAVTPVTDSSVVNPADEEPLQSLLFRSSHSSIAYGDSEAPQLEPELEPLFYQQPPHVVRQSDWDWDEETGRLTWKDRNAARQLRQRPGIGANAIG